MWKVLKTYRLLFILVLSSIAVTAQNNAGIGTTLPHPAAMLQVSDTNRGMLIPKTDTMAIEDYVNSLTPPSTIANGLMIYDVNLKTYVYYDAGLGIWRKLIDLVGDVGPTGPRGPTGIIGEKGHSTDWRDSNNVTPVLLPRDSCGDFYFHNSTGVLWYVECDTFGNRKWVDTLTADNNIGIFRAPEEEMTVIHLSSTGNGNQPPASGGSLNDDVNFFDIDGLNYSFAVKRDQIAYVWVASHGSVSHAFGKNNYSYAQYDIQINGSGISVGHPGKFYFDRDALSNGNMGNIYAISKNGPPPPLQTFGLFDQVGWNVSACYTLEGPLTLPPPCETFCGMTGCPPCPANSFFYNIKTVAGTRVSSGNVDVKLWSGTNTTNEAHMNVFILVRRHPDAIPRKK